MFIGAFFVIGQNSEQQKCPATDEWINELWYIHMMENYLTIKYTIDACRTIDESQKDYFEW